MSVENREHGLPRIDDLREAPAALRFLSIEPLLEDLGTIDLTGIDWVIVGGESGCGARPMDSSWVISIRDQCQAEDVLFFFKQWGGAQKPKHGRHLDGRTYDDMPQRGARSVPPWLHRMTLIDEVTALARETTLELDRSSQSVAGKSRPLPTTPATQKTSSR